MNGITDQSSKYNEVKEQSINLAKSLFSAGIREKDVVGIIAENRLEFPVIAFAAIYLGAIITPINITYTERKFMSYYIFDVNFVFMIYLILSIT